MLEHPTKGSQVSIPVAGTLSEYISAALQHAKYEQIEEEGTYFGIISGFPGLWGHGPTREACQRDLQAALEDWIVFSLVNRDSMPIVDGIEVRADRVV